MYPLKGPHLKKKNFSSKQIFIFSYDKAVSWCRICLWFLLKIFWSDKPGCFKSSPGLWQPTWFAFGSWGSHRSNLPKINTNHLCRYWKSSWFMTSQGHGFFKLGPWIGANMVYLYYMRVISGDMIFLLFFCLVQVRPLHNLHLFQLSYLSARLQLIYMFHLGIHYIYMSWNKTSKLLSKLNERIYLTNIKIHVTEL